MSPPLFKYLTQVFLVSTFFLLVAYQSLRTNRELLFGEKLVILSAAMRSKNC